MKTKHKTVRIGTFESNSSSQHSICIQTKGRSKERESKPLVENGILYPERLSQYTVGFGDSSATVCGDKDTKAAIVVSWIRSWCDDYGSEGLSEDDYLNHLKNELGYKEIDFEGSRWPSFPHCSEYGDGLGFSEESEDNLSRLNDLITIINDDNQEIIDSDSAY